MNWWCSATDRSWSWSPSPYIGAWAIIGAVVALAVWWRVRGRHHDPIVTARAEAALAEGSGPTASSGRTRAVAFGFGLLGLWACLDWPLAALGAGYLASAQMIRQVLMVMAVAPLLLFATPAPLAVRLVGWGRRLRILRLISRPIFAVPFAALTLLAVNAPAVVDPLVATPYGAFAMDAVWIAAGFVLWMPVQCPHPGVRRLTGGAAITYLIGQSIVPVIPGFFMTWGTFAIYATYEGAPRVFRTFDAVTDQQTAAAILQVGGMVVLWVQISYRFLRWAYDQMEEGRVGARPGKPITGTPTGTP